MSGASEKAVEAAVKSYSFDLSHCHNIEIVAVEDCIQAAHDPSLGLDRSVCLRDVVEMASAYDLDMMRDFVEWLEEKFTT